MRDGLPVAMSLRTWIIHDHIDVFNPKHGKFVVLKKEKLFGRLDDIVTLFETMVHPYLLGEDEIRYVVLGSHGHNTGTYTM